MRTFIYHNALKTSGDALVRMVRENSVTIQNVRLEMSRRLHGATDVTRKQRGQMVIFVHAGLPPILRYLIRGGLLLQAELLHHHLDCSLLILRYRSHGVD